MHTTLILIGQCGIQAGNQFLQTIQQNELSGTRSVYNKLLHDSLFKSTPNGYVANAILFDMDEKALQFVINTASICYDKKCIIYGQSGSSNNWAKGYYDRAPHYKEKILEALQYNVEKHGNAHYVLFQSVAGGTGSGVGSYVMKLLRNEFSKALILSISIWPFSDGETAVQAYNSCLYLNVAYENCDGILVLENEQLHEISQKVFEISQPCRNALNNCLPQLIMPVLMPGYQTESELPIPCTLYDTLIHLCSHPEYKLLTPRFVSHSLCATPSLGSNTFEALFKELYRNHHQGVASNFHTCQNWFERYQNATQTFTQFLEESNRVYESLHQPPQGSLKQLTSSNLKVLKTENTQILGNIKSQRTRRSPEVFQKTQNFNREKLNKKLAYRRKNLHVATLMTIFRKETSDPKLVEDFCKKENYYSKASFPIKVYHVPHSILNFPAAISTISNCQSCIPVISRSYSQARILYHSHAYLQHYTAYGMELHDLETSLQNTHAILNSYLHLNYENT